MKHDTYAFDESFLSSNILSPVNGSLASAISPTFSTFTAEMASGYFSPIWDLSEDEEDAELIEQEEHQTHESSTLFPTLEIPFSAMHLNGSDSDAAATADLGTAASEDGTLGFFWSSSSQQQQQIAAPMEPPFPTTTEWPAAVQPFPGSSEPFSSAAPLLCPPPLFVDDSGDRNNDNFFRPRASSFAGSTAVTRHMKLPSLMAIALPPPNLSVAAGTSHIPSLTLTEEDFPPLVLSSQGSGEGIGNRRTRRNSKRHPSPIGCGYCLATSRAGSSSHSRSNCPALASLNPCVQCGASGADNHTIRYCPAVQVVHLEFIPKEQRGRNRNVTM